jgi:hypothetical protein
MCPKTLRSMWPRVQLLPLLFPLLHVQKDIHWIFCHQTSNPILFAKTPLVCLSCHGRWSEIDHSLASQVWYKHMVLEHARYM